MTIVRMPQADDATVAEIAGYLEEMLEAVIKERAQVIALIILTPDGVYKEYTGGDYSRYEMLGALHALTAQYERENFGDEE